MKYPKSVYLIFLSYNGYLWFAYYDDDMIPYYLMDQLDIQHKKGYPHYLTGPAIVGMVASWTIKEWWTFGLPHRLDGPALESICSFEAMDSSGTYRTVVRGKESEFYIHGQRMEEYEFRSTVISQDPIQIASKMLLRAHPSSELHRHVRLSLKVLGMTSAAVDVLVKNIRAAKAIL